MRHLIVTVVMALGLARQAFPQFGCVAKPPDPPTPAQAGALANAKAFLEGPGQESFANKTLTIAPLKGGRIGEAHVSGSDVEIRVDAEKLEKLLPPNAGPNVLAGAMVITIFHELQHTDHGWCNDTCCHILLNAYVSEKHCEFVTWIEQETGYPPVEHCIVLDNLNAAVSAGLDAGAVAACGFPPGTGEPGPCPTCP